MCRPCFERVANHDVIKDLRKPHHMRPFAHLGGTGLCGTGRQKNESAEGRRILIHLSAVNTAPVALSAVRDICNLFQAQSELVMSVEKACERHQERRGRRQSRSDGHIAFYPDLQAMSWIPLVVLVQFIGHCPEISERSSANWDDLTRTPTIPATDVLAE